MLFSKLLVYEIPQFIEQEKADNESAHPLHQCPIRSPHILFIARSICSDLRDHRVADLIVRSPMTPATRPGVVTLPEIRIGDDFAGGTVAVVNVHDEIRAAGHHTDPNTSADTDEMDVLNPGGNLQSPLAALGKLPASGNDFEVRPNAIQTNQQQFINYLGRLPVTLVVFLGGKFGFLQFNRIEFAKFYLRRVCSVFPALVSRLGGRRSLICGSGTTARFGLVRRAATNNCGSGEE